MGQQSILEINKNNYREYFEKEILDFAKKDYIQSKYRVGCEKIDKYELKHNLYIYEILEKCNCELDIYIWKKINGELEEEIKCCKK